MKGPTMHTSSRCDSGHLPAWGDTLTLQERKMADCLGFSRRHPSCPVREPPASGLSLYPAGGYDYEAQQPPLGYLPYVLTANPHASPSVAIEAARRGGIIWAGISGALLLVLAALEDFSLVGLAALLATCLFNPVFTYSAATVNNDSAGIAIGAVALIALSWSRRRPRFSLALGAIAGALIGLTKGLYIAVPFALVIAAIVEEGRQLLSVQGLKDAFRRHLCVVSMLVISVLAYGVFTLVQDARATVAPSTVLRALLGFSHVATLQPSTLSTSVSNAVTLSAVLLLQRVERHLGRVCLWSARRVLVPRDPTGRGETCPGLSLGIFVGALSLAIGWALLVFVQGHYNSRGPSAMKICLLPLIGYVLVQGCRRFGLVAIGIAFPVLCAVVQLASGKY